jgi:glycosyltransferase involved in cell wall biosynthesis
LVINDGSTDGTAAQVTFLADQDARVRQIILPANVGLANALNVGIQEAKSDFIARMDADDESLPDRFTSQFRALHHRNLDLVGGALIGAQSGHFYRVYAGVDSEVTARDLWLSSPLFHPTWLGKASLFRDTSYRDVVPVEDLDFLLRAFLAGAKLGNIPDPVLTYREAGEKITTGMRTPQIFLTWKLRRDLLGNNRVTVPADMERLAKTVRKWERWLYPVAQAIEFTRIALLKLNSRYC